MAVIKVGHRRINTDHIMYVDCDTNEGGKRPGWAIITLAHGDPNVITFHGEKARLFTEAYDMIVYTYDAETGQYA